MLLSILIYYFHYPRIRSPPAPENGAATNCNNSDRPRLVCKALTKIKRDIIREIIVVLAEATLALFPLITSLER
jgi:hypothetical protein